MNDAISLNTRAIVQQFFATMDSGDVEKIQAFMQEHFAPDIEWRVMGSGVPGAGSARGRDKVIEVISGVRTLFEPGYPRGTVIRIVADGQWAAAETEAAGPMRDGRVYRNSYAFFIQVSGAQILALHEYFDSFYVNQLLK